jgi:glycosyltransferase involved in cell wall biosynthesis
LIEALGCECPVVASDLEAVKDVIIPERNGLLTRPGDRNGIAAAILHLLQEPVLAADMASRGRQYVLSRFNWDIVAARYADLMDEMIR